MTTCCGCGCRKIDDLNGTWRVVERNIIWRRNTVTKSKEMDNFCPGCWIQQCNQEQQKWESFGSWFSEINRGYVNAERKSIDNEPNF